MKEAKFRQGFFGDMVCGPRAPKNTISSIEKTDKTYMVNVYFYSPEYKCAADRWLKSLPSAHLQKVIAVLMDQGHAYILWKEETSPASVSLACGQSAMIEVPYPDEVTDYVSAIHYNKF